MPGIARGETVGVSNPLLFFAYQTNGLLTDVVELRLQIKELQTGVVRVADGPVNIADPPAGVRLGVGRYAAAFTAESTWNPCTHVAVWTYKTVAGGPSKTYRQTFELLHPDEFASGAGFVGYADSDALRRASPFNEIPVRDVQRLIDTVSRRIEMLTARFFEPRYVQTGWSGTDAPELLLSLPIIGLDTIYELGIGPSDQIGELDRTSLRVFNRHLEGLLDPDDRANPRLAYATEILPGRTVEQGSFSEGEKNLEIRGVFGYTDPDGGPMGMTPRPLTRAVGALAAREYLDPFGQDIATSTPGRIKSAKTRDQSIDFDASAATSFGALTGDRIIDDILIQYLRPPHLGAV